MPIYPTIEALAKQHVDLWVFDNDGTLYTQHKAVEVVVVEFMMAFITKQFGVSREDAIQKRKDLLQKHNTQYTLIALREEGIPESLFIQETYLKVDPTAFGITPSPRLKQLLRQLPGEKVVLTNNPAEFAEKILRAIGVREHFSAIYGMHEIDYKQKPAPEAFAILDRYLKHGQRVVFVDDEMPNIRTASQLGCLTVHVPNGI